MVGYYMRMPAGKVALIQTGLRIFQGQIWQALSG
jgi:hypothetical protein